LSFSSPEQVRFKYRMVGLDKDWVEAGTQRSVNYDHLRPDTYTFQVIACNNHGVWNLQGASLNFTVLPHFWETSWFMGLATIGGAGGLGGTVAVVARRRLKRRLEQTERQRMMERERTRIARDIHDHLGASLTRIAMLSESLHKSLTDNSDGAMLARRVNSTAREVTRSMDEIVWAVNPKHDTLDSLANYVGGFAHDYMQGAGLRCRLDVPVQLPGVLVPADVRHNLFLAVKEALHNVVKHANATEVEIRVRAEEGMLSIIIADNGCGFRPKPAGDTQPGRIAHGNGLANMRQRMCDLGGTCEWESLPERGTQVALKLKLAR
jgi:signal transduction histidine kinase